MKVKGYTFTDKAGDRIKVIPAGEHEVKKKYGVDYLIVVETKSGEKHYVGLPDEVYTGLVIAYLLLNNADGVFLDEQISDRETKTYRLTFVEVE